MKTYAQVTPMVYGNTFSTTTYKPTFKKSQTCTCGKIAYVPWAYPHAYCHNLARVGKSLSEEFNNLDKLWV